VKFKLRSYASVLVRRHRWLPFITVLLCAAVFVTELLTSASHFWTLGAAAVLAFACYVWGYAIRAMRASNYPSLLNLPRRQYGEVWDSIAKSPEWARAGACGHQDEAGLCRSVQSQVGNLTELAGVRPHDDILEFGCGVARIGRELAPLCRTWTGADLSANMLTTAAERLQGVTNVRLVKLQQVGLDEFESGSFDLVYSTNMLAHLDGMDRWRYVKDAFRVLRPGGRLCIDNIDLESNEGWGAFSRGSELAQELERPPYQPTPSTGAELTTYALRAGFGQVHAHKRAPLVIVTAIKVQFD
jgi:SAM-dependent methyltransferase